MLLCSNHDYVIYVNCDQSYIFLPIMIGLGWVKNDLITVHLLLLLKEKCATKVGGYSVCPHFVVGSISQA